MTPTHPSFSFSTVWDDTQRMLVANAGLLTAIAGVFLFLPALLLARFVEPMAAADDGAAMVRELQAYMGRAWPWLLASNLLNMTGIIAMYLLLLEEARPTVGRAVARALTILPFYWLLTILLNVIWGIGFLLLIVPFIYLLGRLVLASPVLVIEHSRAPIAALQRAWALSAHRGWAIALLVLAVYLAAGLIGLAVRVTVGSLILALLGPQGLGGLVLAAVLALVNAAGVVVAVVLIAGIYRSATGPDTPAVVLGKSPG